MSYYEVTETAVTPWILSNIIIFLPCFRKSSITCVARLAGFALSYISLRVTAKMKIRWSVDGTIRTGDDRSTRRRVCTHATLSTTSPAWTDPGSISDLCGERLETNRSRRTQYEQMFERNIAARSVAIVAVEEQWEYVLRILIVCCL